MGQSIVHRAAMDAELLDVDTESALARAWKEDGDVDARNRLVTAYLRLAIGKASAFKRYGHPWHDLVQEASIGLMKATEKFDPDLGVRFSTYAHWWVIARLQFYVLRNQSMVRMGLSAEKKKLFFNMRRVRGTLEQQALARGEHVDGQQLRERIATELEVSVRDVEVVEGLFASSSLSLNMSHETEEGEGREWIDVIADDGSGPDEIVARIHDAPVLSRLLKEALSTLRKRERYILTERMLLEQPRTLESIANELGLSKERIRQIQATALSKLQKRLAEHKSEVEAFLD